MKKLKLPMCVCDVSMGLATASILLALNLCASEYAFLSQPDYSDDPARLKSGFVIPSAFFTANDGIVRYDPATTNDWLMANCSAEAHLDSLKWLNTGFIGSSLDLKIQSAVTLEAVSSTHAGITYAHKFDASQSSYLYIGTGTTLDGMQDILGGRDTQDATFEFWVKATPNDLVGIKTLFETGGGTGLGVILDSGVLKAALGTKVAQISYNLLTDTLGVLTGDITNEFFHVAFVVDLTGNVNFLYVNGALVGSAGNTVNDWCGGDGAGWGHFQGANHGGFVSPAAGTAYDTYYNGYMAAFRAYNAALTAGQVLQNYRAVHTGGRDAEDDILYVDGVYDATNGLITAKDTPIPLSSGATASIDSVTYALTYDASGVPNIENLAAGISYVETLTYRAADGTGDFCDSTARFTVYGLNQSVNDALEAQEDAVTTFTAGQLLGNDTHTQGAGVPWFGVNVGALTTNDLMNRIWRNQGTSGTSCDAPISSGTLVDSRSGFGGIGKAWQRFAGNVPDPAFDSISTSDATFEFWFRPAFGYEEDQVLFDVGGSGNGTSFVYSGRRNQLTVTVDAGADTDANTLQQAVLPDISLSEFNHVVVVFDKNASNNIDTLTAYLNNDPSAAFDDTPDAKSLYASTGCDDYCGSNISGIGMQANTLARTVVADSFKGELAVVRVFDRALTLAEIASNYEGMREQIISVSPATTALGATVTLEADGTVTYDATALLSDIPDGATVQDTFTYTVSDGVGGTTVSTGIVSVAGIGLVHAADDTLQVAATNGNASVTVLANDLGASGATTVSTQVTIANYRTDFQTGVTNSAPADFRDGSGYGWRYLWNAPTDWETGTFDGSTGALTSTNDYDLLVWDETLLEWNSNATANRNDGPPSNYLRLDATGGHPGRSYGETAGVTNSQSRYAIAAYTVGEAGWYSVANGFARKIDVSGDAVEIKVAVNDGAPLLMILSETTATVLFSQNVGYLNAGDTIYVAAGAYNNSTSDQFFWDFDIVKCPSGDFEAFRLRGTVSLDSGTCIYNPNGAFTGLGMNETATETFSYLMDENGTQSIAHVTVTLTGVNDAPTTVADNITVSEASPLSGSLTANDSDPDYSDYASLGVAEINGSPNDIGMPVTTSLGSVLTINANGSFTYAPGNALHALALGESVSEAFEYRVQDPYGLDATNTAIVTFIVQGANDGVIATSNHYEVIAGHTVSGNLMLDDTGSGLDSSIDTNETPTVYSVNTNGTLGRVQINTLSSLVLMGTRGVISDLTTTPQVVQFDAVGGRFQNPVVFAGPFSFNDREPSWLVVTNVDAQAGTFVIALQEEPEGTWSDGDGDSHTNEVCPWMVFEKGNYILPDGTRMEIGTEEVSAVRQNAAGAWQTVTYSEPFTNQPVVLHQLQTRNYNVELVGTRMEGALYSTGPTTSNAFSVALEDYAPSADNRNSPAPKAETVGWLAIERVVGHWNGVPYEAGVTGLNVDEYGATDSTRTFSAAFTSLPVFIGSIATYAGSDSCVLRYGTFATNKIDLIANEQKILDEEQNHADENVTYLAIQGAGDLYARVAADLGTGGFTYDPGDAVQPAPGETITDSFSYTITDPYGLTDTQQVTVKVYSAGHLSGTIIRVW